CACRPRTGVFALIPCSLAWPPKTLADRGGNGAQLRYIEAFNISSHFTSVRVNRGRNRRNRQLARVWAMGRGGVDLNEVGPPVLLFRGDIPGEANVYGQDPVRPADGFSAVDDICADCRAVWWRPVRQVVALRRTLPGYGVCPTDLSGESQRHRSLPVGPSLEALSHGVPRTDSALDAVRRERSPRLAHLRRL